MLPKLMLQLYQPSICITLPFISTVGGASLGLAATGLRTSANLARHCRDSMAVHVACMLQSDGSPWVCAQACAAAGLLLVAHDRGEVRAYQFSGAAGEVACAQLANEPSAHGCRQ